MVRLDKFLCERKIGTRSEVKEFIKRSQVCVNQEVIKDGAFKIDETNDKVTYLGRLLPVSKFQYFLLNKPAGVVSATKDAVEQTVLDLITEEKKEDLFPVGRLDKDTEGLLLITNDGDLAHELLSPKKHVQKTYYVKLSNPITMDSIRVIEDGVDIGEEKKTLPALVKTIGEYEIYLTIMEGKFHQVKRMLHAVGNEVIFLKRIQMGPLVLDEKLETGCYRPLLSEEVAALKNIKR